MISFICQPEWKIQVKFVKHVVREYGEGGSNEIKMDSETLKCNLQKEDSFIAS